MLEAICSCKLYRSSKHPEKILAALSQATNVELVKQLTDYLDDEYQPKNSVEPVVDDFGESSGQSSGDAPSDGPSGGSHASSGGFSGGGGRLSFTPSDGGSSEDFDESGEGSEVEGEDGDTSDVAAEEPEVEDSEPELEDVEESTKVHKKRTTTSKNISTVTASTLMSQIEQIKGTLNLVNTTQGVVRVLLQDKELWVYYNDSINLNNVIDAAIERLCMSFTYLKFNRLARSNNAIVFDVSFSDSDNAVMNPPEDEKS